MELYEAWATFSETGNILDYLHYTALKEKEELQADFPEYFSDDTQKDKGE